jgi:hypothetical protein
MKFLSSHNSIILVNFFSKFRFSLHKKEKKFRENILFKIWLKWFLKEFIFFISWEMIIVWIDLSAFYQVIFNEIKLCSRISLVTFKTKFKPFTYLIMKSFEKWWFLHHLHILVYKMSVLIFSVFNYMKISFGAMENIKNII